MTKKPRVERVCCMHCGACVGCCPENAIVLEEVWIEISDRCKGCGICERACPAGAIVMEGK